MQTPQQQQHEYEHYEHYSQEESTTMEAEQQQQQQQQQPVVTCNQAAVWTDFTASWNAFGSSATSWWESAASSWQPALRETDLDEQHQAANTPNSPAAAHSFVTARSQDSEELANAKRQAYQNSYHLDFSKSRSQSVRKELKQMKSTVTSTTSSTTDGSETFQEDESIWDTTASRMQVFDKTLRQHANLGHKNKRGQQGEGDEVDKSAMGGCCQRPWWYKLLVVILLLAIVLCAAVVALTSMDIVNKTSDNDNSNGKQDYSLQNNNGNTIATESPITTDSPTKTPTLAPTTASPTTSPPTEQQDPVTYIPGKLTVSSNGLLLSEGLSSRIIANAGQPVTLTGLPPLTTTNANGAQSSPVYYKSTESFHTEPDGAAVFPWVETGGWVYVSNSESKEPGTGGVGAIYFDKDGNVLDYQRLLDGTTMNCSGGPTPWGTWVSCEEIDGGKAYQVDPFGIRPPAPLSTLDTGFFEAFAHDIRNPQEPKFYVTEDKERGPLRRIIPSNPDWEDPWEILHGLGTLEYLVLVPNPQDDSKGTYYWTTERETAKVNSQQYYKHSEGIDVHNDQLFFVSKEQKELFILNLDDTNMVYEVHSTVSGVFDGHPDQMKRLIQNGLLYFCEEGGQENGVHARDDNGWFFTILESLTLSDETTGLAFSPDGKHMYVSYQHNGLIFDVTRDDGLAFHGRTLNVKYHEIHQQR